MIRVASLFSGIGGFRLAFERVGRVESVFACELDRFAQQTYAANFGGDDASGDATLIDADGVPDHDILTAGFPCQAFSKAGSRKGFEDTRGTLFFDVARVLVAKRPSVVLLENVKNLVFHDKGKTLAVILRTLESLDYEVHWRVLRARDFGLPQNRERVFIVGFNRQVFSNDSGFVFPSPPETATRLGSILEGDPADKYTLSDKGWGGMRERKIAHLVKGNGFGYSLFDEDSPYVSTLLARYWKDGSDILIRQVGKNPRRLTPRECARLQGFPDSFVIPVSDMQAYKQFGNTIAIPVVEAVALQILAVFGRLS